MWKMGDKSIWDISVFRFRYRNHSDPFLFIRSRATQGIAKVDQGSTTKKHQPTKHQGYNLVIFAGKIL